MKLAVKRICFACLSILLALGNLTLSVHAEKINGVTKYNDIVQKTLGIIGKTKELAGSRALYEK